MPSTKPFAELEAFLSGATEAPDHNVSRQWVEDLTPSQVAELNAIVGGLDNARFKFERNESGGARFFKVAPVGGTLYTNGKEDARVGGAPPENPFRSRYRSLSKAEVEHHDRIKDKAFDLLQAIKGIPAVRNDAGLESPNVVHRDMAIANTHLEDVVMRAVRALTA